MPTPEHSASSSSDESSSSDDDGSRPAAATPQQPALPGQAPEPLVPDPQPSPSPRRQRPLPPVAPPRSGRKKLAPAPNATPAHRMKNHTSYY